MKKKDIKCLNDYIKKIEPRNRTLEREAFIRLDNLTKPKRSLGDLEAIAAKLFSIFHGHMPEKLNKAVYVFAGDHGVSNRGVSAYPKEVTYQMVYNFLNNGAAINVLSKHIGAQVFVVDVGVDYDFDKKEKLISKKVKKGTEDFTTGQAMEIQDAIDAIFVGIDCAERAIKKGFNLLIPGEMGIGNTTSSSAIIKVITGKELEKIVGIGTGVDKRGYENKLKAIQDALKVNRPDKKNPLDILHKVGGLEIAAICGFVLACAANKKPVVIDGFISTAGFLISYLFSKHVKDYAFFSHQSAEPGHKAAFAFLRVKPILNLNLRLGEGTGAVLATNIIEAAVKIFNEMATFEEAAVSRENK